MTHVELLERAEQVVDQDGRFQRATLALGEATARVSRQGWTVEVRARLRASRARHSTTLTGSGDTLEEAVQNLADSLDSWAGAIG